MKKIILLLLLILLLVIPFSCISSLSIVSAIGTAGVSADRTCEYSSGTFKDETVEAQRENVKRNLIKPEYTNAALGIYQLDRNSSIKGICSRLNELIEYAAIQSNNHQIITVPVYIQAFLFGSDYIDFLLDKSETYTLQNAKEYQEKNNDRYKEHDYQYALKALSGISETCALGVGGLPLDKDSYTVTSGFPYRNDGTFHAGLDMGVPYGSNVYAVNDAVVLMTGTTCPPDGGSLGNTCGFGGVQGAGNFVLYQIKVNNESYTVLSCHLSQVFVKEGDKIVSGQQIGLSGNSGNSSGAHLHLEIHTLHSTNEDDQLQESISYIGTDKKLINPCGFIDGLCVIN